MKRGKEERQGWRGWVWLGGYDLGVAKGCRQEEALYLLEWLIQVYPLGLLEEQYWQVPVPVPGLNEVEVVRLSMHLC